MKKSGALVLVFVLATILLGSFVSANWFSDTWNKITGKAIEGSGSGLIGYYPFDANANDASGNGNDGTLQNGASYVSGKFGNAVSFDGIDDYVKLNPSKMPDSQFTVSLWAFIDNSPKGCNGACPGSGEIIFFGENYRKYGMASLTYGGQGAATTQISLGSYAVNGPTTPSGEVPRWEWVYITGVYDGSKIYIYINGVNKAESAFSGLSPLKSSFNLGYRETYPGYFHGKMDEVRVYNRALSASEVLDLYNLVPASTPIPSITCNDSDGGNNSLVYGEVTLSNPVGFVKRDYCAYTSAPPTPNYVQEYFCVGSTYGSNLISCPNGCLNGTCVASTSGYPKCCCGANVGSGNFTYILNATQETQCNSWGKVVTGDITRPSDCGPICLANQVTCNDSDNGLNYDVKGTINFSVGNSRYFVDDYCRGDDVINGVVVNSSEGGRLLVEGTCIPGGIYQQNNYTCPNGCFNGACNATTPVSQIPSAPSNLIATTLSESQILLNWVDNSNNEAGFTIYKAISESGSWSLMAVLGSNITNYTSRGLGGGTTYYYLVKASSASSGYSNSSNIAHATTLLDTEQLTRCGDNDGGFNYSLKGIVTYLDSSQYLTVEDNCSDSITLIEQSCDVNGYKNSPTPYACPNGCSNGACLASSTTNESNLSCSNGCSLNNSCVPFGFRKSGQYCEMDGRMYNQKVNVGNITIACENNYECLSNVCTGGSCFDLQGAVASQNSFKVLVVRILCRLSNIFDDENYPSCIASYIQ